MYTSIADVRRQLRPVLCSRPLRGFCRWAFYFYRCASRRHDASPRVSRLDGGSFEKPPRGLAQSNSARRCAGRPARRFSADQPCPPQTGGLRQSDEPPRWRSGRRPGGVVHPDKACQCLTSSAWWIQPKQHRAYWKFEAVEATMMNGLVVAVPRSSRRTRHRQQVRQSHRDCRVDDARRRRLAQRPMAACGRRRRELGG